MPPSAKPYPLAANKAAPRAGRSLSKREFALPKPYRRKRFVEDGVGMSRLRMVALSMSALAIAGLIAALALLVKENLASPPIPIIAAPTPAAVAAVPAKRPVAPAVFLAPAHQPAPAPPLAAALPLVPPPVKRIAPVQARPESATADPDVVLITAILTLTPPPEPEAAPGCSPATSGDDNCAAVHVPDPR